MKPFPLSRPVSSLLIIAVTSLPRDAEGSVHSQDPSEGAACNQNSHLYVQK